MDLRSLEVKLLTHTSPTLPSSTSAFTPIDPAPAAPSKDLSAVSVPSLRGQLLDTKLSLFERYRAMFALRNVAHVGGEAAEKAVLALADGLRDESALFR